jgi:hypothetical protein
MNATMILISNGPDHVTRVHCPINKPLHDLCNPNPWRLSLTSSNYRNVPSKISLEHAL